MPPAFVRPPPAANRGHPGREPSPTTKIAAAVTYLMMSFLQADAGTYTVLPA
jgi:hypothetical protein